MLAVLDAAGPIALETVVSCDWEVDRSGLINLDHPTARAAGLTDSPEPIQVYFHVLRHPTRGTFIVDTGVERALRDAPDQAAYAGLVAKFMHLERMKVHQPLADWLEREGRLDGVFLTHLHSDHLSGMPDVPHGTPIYSGPGEAASRGALNFLAQPALNRALEGHEPISELQFQPDPDGRFAGVVDVFGDGTLWALLMPGHTVGSLAFVARTPSGPVLMTGDTSHTRWGWEHDVEPGWFTDDHAANAASLAKLKQLVAEHPAMQVRLGHQPLGAEGEGHAAR
ncbi:MAG: MBL fold metallo-hydrolase [Archangiaceae bacterium]|nr:MBL fold metallo-hydrolase [Archangiaceae bacterium]